MIHALLNALIGRLEVCTKYGGRGYVISISDNAKMFVAAAKWLKTLEKDEDFNNYIGQQGTKWRFNLSRAPWWGVSLRD